MMVSNPHRWGAFALAALLLGACSVKVGKGDDEPTGSDADTVNDGENGDGSTIGNPDLKIRGGDDDPSDSSTGGDGDSGDGGSGGDGDTSGSSSNGGNGEDVPEDNTMVVDGPDPSIPMYLIAECGTIESADLPVSSSRSNPTEFTVGQLAGGRIDPDSVTNQEHFWKIKLTKGFYHVVLDTETSDGDDTNIGLQVDSLDENGVDQGRVLRGNEIARRYRGATFIEVEEDATIGLRVSPNFGMEDYLIGVFKNGTEVPSPRFVDCPTINPLTLGEAASFTLEAEDTPDEEEWFSLDLDVGDYLVVIESAQADGNETNLQYTMDVIDRFGQVDRDEHVVRANEIDTSFAASGMLTVGEKSHHFVRFVNNHNELDMKVTVSEE